MPHAGKTMRVITRIFQIIKDEMSARNGLAHLWFFIFQFSSWELRPDRQRFCFVIGLQYKNNSRVFMQKNIAIFPRLAGLSLAGKPVQLRSVKQPCNVIPRRELQRLIADMVD